MVGRYVLLTVCLISAVLVFVGVALLAVGRYDPGTGPQPVRPDELGERWSGSAYLELKGGLSLHEASVVELFGEGENWFFIPVVPDLTPVDPLLAPLEAADEDPERTELPKAELTRLLTRCRLVVQAKPHRVKAGEFPYLRRQGETLRLFVRGPLREDIAAQIRLDHPGFPKEGVLLAEAVTRLDSMGELFIPLAIGLVLLTGCVGLWWRIGFVPPGPPDRRAKQAKDLKTLLVLVATVLSLTALLLAPEIGS